MTGAPGASAASASNTAGNSSYSTSISASARSAVASSTAATAATSSPTYRTRSRARICSSSRAGLTPYHVSGTSSAVMTASTPGSARARDASRRVMIPCATGLPRILPIKVPGGR